MPDPKLPQASPKCCGKHAAVMPVTDAALHKRLQFKHSLTDGHGEVIPRSPTAAKLPSLIGTEPGLFVTNTRCDGGIL